MGNLGPRQAVFIAAMTSALIVAGIVGIAGAGESPWFIAGWVAIGIGVIVTALRKGFSPGQERDKPPAVRLSKPGAVVGAIAGVAIIVFGFVKIDGPFVPVWAAFVVAIIVFNLWTAFGSESRRRS